MLRALAFREHPQKNRIRRQGGRGCARLAAPGGAFPGLPQADKVAATYKNGVEVK